MSCHLTFEHIRRIFKFALLIFIQISLINNVLAESVDVALVEISCSSKLFSKLSEIVPIERRLSQEVLSYEEYKKLNDQRNYYWLDASGYLNNELALRKLSKKDLIKYFGSEKGLWKLSYELSEKIDKSCPEKARDLGQGVQVFEALISLNEHLSKTKE